MSRTIRLRFFVLHICLIAVFCLSGITIPAFGQSQSSKKVLILFEGNDITLNYARADARQLAVLLGHFNADYKLKAVNSYSAGDINNFDISFFIGFSKHCEPPEKFMRDVFLSKKQFIWMNTGIHRFNSQFDLSKQFGFSFVNFDSVSNYDIVKTQNTSFTKGEQNLNLISIQDKSRVEVLATAYSSSTRRESPYIVRSNHFMYIADSPFANATSTDRYLLFANMLHDILDEQHEESHRALIRIEDVDVFENPNKLRDIADMLYSKNVPFLVGVIPFFVDPEAGIRVSLSDKPEFVDAIHYMIAHGATIVMHGVTHQYQGVTASDFEFWDGSKDRPIKNDSKEYVEKKIKMGLEECWKNSIYPLVWETPHYTASQTDYSVFGEFFSTAMEQRLVMDDPDYSQYYPYIIEHDLFGQRIIPENLGYIPLDDNPNAEEAAVQDLLKGAKAHLTVKDGLAGAFIHPFIDLKYMEEFVDGMLDLGYTFADIKNEPALVRLKDRITVTGKKDIEITLEDQYLREIWLKPDGEIDHQEISQNRIPNALKKSVDVPEGEIYIAEPAEYREAELSFMQKLQHQTTSLWQNMFENEQPFDDARVAVLWDSNAKGNSYNNQASFISAFQSLNISVDTLDIENFNDLSQYNLVAVPYHIVDHLINRDYDRLTQFVEDGGNLITDGKNSLAEELGIKFAKSFVKIERMRDRLYPEDPLVLSKPEIMSRIEADPSDEIFCTDERTETPTAIGRHYANGKFIFLGIRFDPLSTGGFSRYPYLLEYIRTFFRLQPILKRNNLEVYFDPGYRHNISIEELSKRWAADGIRAIHAAGWHQYPTWAYDYKRLIDVCHANGILVYAWLEPPQVSPKFWKDHPEWQETNFKKEAVRSSWRYPMALTNRECLTAVKSFYQNFLLEYDWDGVNIAELYFESGNGPQYPFLFSPMHSSAREDFKYRAGFDPALLLDSLSEYYWRNNAPALKRYEDYRVDVLTRLHEEFLKTTNDVQHTKPYLDVIVTAMDNIGNPELRPYFGIDISRIIELKKRYDFTLQVEDPQSEWSKDPRRYRQIAKRYQSLPAHDTTIMLDLNILQFRNENIPTRFPTLIQTGIECYHLVHSASAGSDRVTIYSESSIRPQDLRMLSFASASKASVRKLPNGIVIDAPYAVVLQLPQEYIGVTTSDGRALTSEQGMFLLPAGRDTLITKKRNAGPFQSLVTGGQLLSITGELTELNQSNRSISFSYTSSTRCIASFSHRPYTFLLDGKEYNVEPSSGYRRYSMILPPGEHTCIAILETKVAYGVDITSFWSSWLIVGFGLISGVVLFTFYGVVKISRPTEAQSHG